jgi:ribonuclease E
VCSSDLRPSYRGYKIQEVIKRRQILLVQVVKEERGNKGAALTTYLSLAGRYCVLMPNTNRGGGISRKISNPADRKRLKAVLDYLDIPEGLGVIVRTAGAERSKTEIKRDYDYLMKQWIAIRELTLASTAPTLIYEEANLIKRSIRDLYSSEIDEILVAGDEAYRVAKTFMKTMVPSHAVRVKPYKDDGIPILHRYKVESQIDAIHHPIVQLPSGGYIVLNSTEALVAIDVNSGRATRGRSIEETAYKTNLEASEEIARQLRLRDLAGLVVIDYIDMEVSRNIHAVERKLKEALRVDRARIQVGRISHFGLLEMSRQRLRPSVMESAGVVCPTCAGSGHVRSVEATALFVLRALEEEGISKPSARVTLHVPTPVALYILNQKRVALAEIEARYDFAVTVKVDDALVSPDYRLDRQSNAADPETPKVASDAVTDDGNETESAPRKRRPRRRRSGRQDEAAVQTTSAEATGTEDVQPADVEPREETPSADESEGRPKRRRRGRRGGRRRSQKSAEATPENAQTNDNMVEGSGGAEPVAAAPTPVATNEAAIAVPDTAAPDVRDDATPASLGDATPDSSDTPEAPQPSAEDATPVAKARRPRRRRTPRRKPAVAPDTATSQPSEAVSDTPEMAKDSAPAPTPAPKTAKDSAPAPTPAPKMRAEPAVVEAPVAASAPPPVEDKPKRGGWWQRVTR